MSNIIEELQQDIRKYTKSSEEIKDNYEREVIAHSSTIQSISSIKQNNIDLNERLVNSQVSYYFILNQRNENLAESRLKEFDATWNRMKIQFEGEITGLKKRCQDLIDQNALLHSNFEQAIKNREDENEFQSFEEDSSSVINGELDHSTQTIQLTTHSTAQSTEQPPQSPPHQTTNNHNLQNQITFLTKEIQIKSLEFDKYRIKKSDYISDLINQLELTTFELNKTNSIQTKSLLENDILLLKINTLEKEVFEQKQEINSFNFNYNLVFY